MKLKPQEVVEGFDFNAKKQKNPTDPKKAEAIITINQNHQQTIYFEVLLCNTRNNNYFF
jgi:hypothetical protein